MSLIEPASKEPLAVKNSLLRILGVPFGIAVIIGGTVGVGILRSPGAIAGQLNSVWPIVLVWVVGGLYSLLGANYMAELATMVPKAGGPYVFAHRAYGGYGGFVVGWGDWLLNTLSLSYMCIVFGEYSASLFAPGLANAAVYFAVLVLILLTGLNWIGLRVGSGTQQVSSLLKAVALLAFVAACFVYGGNDHTAAKPATPPLTGFPLFVAVVLAFQLVLGTYSGWFSSVYFSEEDTDPDRNIPRALFGGIALIIAIYVLVNLALLYVLPLDQLAGAKFAGADAMRIVFGERSSQIVTALAILSIVGIINATLMFTPRTLFALGRDNLFFEKATSVNRGGTPHAALAMTALPAMFFVVVGTFEMLVAIAEFFAVTNTILLITSLFVLRRREPDTPRPFRAWGYPYAPLTMLIAAILIFLGYLVGNFGSSIYAVAAIGVSYPIFRLGRRQKGIGGEIE
jgi:basic amino acid/polyamine antiporter, APA family